VLKSSTNDLDVKTISCLPFKNVRTEKLNLQYMYKDISIIPP